MADVQPENGYTRIADELLEILPKHKFNGTQLRIIMIVWRYTYGFGRKDHEMSISFFVTATGLGKTQIDRELKTLIERNVLIVTQEPHYTQTRKLAFNKHYDKWEIEFTSPQKRGQSAKTLTVSENAEEQSAKTSTQTVSKNADQDIHSFINNSINNTTTEDDDFRKVSKAYGQIHAKYDVEPKYYPLLTKLLKDGMTADFMIGVMEQRHKEKIAAGESISGFGYYEPVFKEKFNARFKVFSGKRTTDWDSIEKQLKEAERGSKPGA